MRPFVKPNGIITLRTRKMLKSLAERSGGVRRPYGPSSSANELCLSAISRAGLRSCKRREARTALGTLSARCGDHRSSIPDFRGAISCGSSSISPFPLANSTTVVAPLEASAKDTESDHLRGILTSIAYTAKKKNFAAAFEEFKDEFPVEVIGLLKFGQRLNKLPLACATLAKYFARSERTSAAVWNVLAYPIAMITLIGGLMAAFILIGTPMIVDQFRVMNKTIAIEPPLDTYYALAMIARNPLVDLLGLALLAIIISGAVWYSKREEVQNFYSSVRFKAGVFGTIVRESNQARIADLLSACVEFGLQEHEYLPLLRDSSRDRTYRHALDEMVANQRQNKTKVELLFDAPEIMGRKLFDRLFVSTVAKIKDGKSKDGTGAATMLASLAEHKFRWVDSIVHRLRTIIEPALIVFLVIIAGFLAWTVFAPLYQMILNLTNSGSGGG